MEEELMQYQRENERLEDNLLTCQREIRRLHAVVREYEWENRKLEEFIQSKMQDDVLSDETVCVLQEIYDYIRR